LSQAQVPAGQKILQVFQFVGVTITNKLASNSPTAAGLSAKEQEERQLENIRLVSYSMTFAAIAGTVTSVGLLAFGPQILSAMGTNSVMMAPALSYLSWRALAAPAVLVMNVCQGICLGQQNSITPLAVFASVGIANVVLDMWLILGQGMGCGGAAIATAIAQWAGVLYFLLHLYKKVCPRPQCRPPSAKPQPCHPP
jgi:Na+-driven multidrug efflux pump